jgi:steroid delta-isomerase-like uncharacterized protein
VSSRYETASLHSDPRGGVIMKRAVEKYWVSALICVVLLLCFSVACQDKAAMAELEKFRAQAKLEEVNKDLAKRVMEALNKEDLVALKELMAPEFVRYSPSTTIDIHSLDEFSEFVKMLHSSLPDIHLSIEESYAAGDRVTIRYLMSATHTGEFMGMPATGNKLGTSGVLIFRIENGKVAEIREEYDSVGFMQQLGMELRPKEVKKKSN